MKETHTLSSWSCWPLTEAGWSTRMGQTPYPWSLFYVGDLYTTPRTLTDEIYTTANTSLIEELHVKASDDSCIQAALQKSPVEAPSIVRYNCGHSLVEKVTRLWEDERALDAPIGLIRGTAEDQHLILEQTQGLCTVDGRLQNQNPSSLSRSQLLFLEAFVWFGSLIKEFLQ